MSSSQTRRATHLVVASSLVVAGALALGAQTLGEPAKYIAAAVNGNGRGTSQIEIVVNRWSTEGERNRLLEVLFDKGQDKLLETLQDAPKVGYVRSPSSVGWDLHYAQHTPLPEGGERVIVATDRPLSFSEEANQARTVDYPFTVIQLNLNRDGEGEGTMSIAAKLTADKETKTIVLENFGIQPVQLLAVKRERVSH
jgi:hypothetical protein